MHKKITSRLICLLIALACLMSFASASTVEFVIDDNEAQAIAEDRPIGEAADEPAPAASAADTGEVVDAAQAYDDGKTYDGLPWYLVLVNADHEIPADYVIPEFTNLRNNQKVDSRIYPQLQAMFDECRRQGITPIVLTSYRTYEDQKNMLTRKYNSYRKQGKSKSEAQALALKVAAYPNHSEHQLGLAVDIDSSNTSKCSNEKVWSWMQHNCHKYGFIWRYPGSKSDITGISNEGWHFRYVGVEAATYIMEHQIVLEEYLEEKYNYK